MRRFFVGEDALEGDRVVVEGPLAHRMTAVLRLRAGDEVAFFDGAGRDVVVTLATVSPRRVVGEVTAAIPSPPEPRTSVHLFQSITKGERFEWLVEKATEIGVSTITPLRAARAVVQPSGGGARAERWRRIATEAAEQCERGAVPAIGAPVLWRDAIEARRGILLVPYEEAGNEAPGIGSALRERIDELYATSEVTILIGPEGGLEPREVEEASAAGGVVVTLGERVLRSETAGLVALTLVLEACGELG